jgi:hypothetical protein
MRKILPAAAFLLTSLLTVQAADARAIENACLRSERPAATRALCSCIQRVADEVLSFSDQRRASQFFRNPELAQQVRASTAPDDAAFWGRYREFGNRAEARCTRS